LLEGKRTRDFAFVSLCYGRSGEEICTGYAMAASGQMQYDYKQTNPMYMATSTLSLSYDTSLNLSPIGARNPAASRSERREQRENLGTRASPSSGMLK